MTAFSLPRHVSVLAVNPARWALLLTFALLIGPGIACTEMVPIGDDTDYNGQQHFVAYPPQGTYYTPRQPVEPEEPETEALPPLSVTDQPVQVMELERETPPAVSTPGELDLPELAPPPAAPATPPPTNVKPGPDVTDVPGLTLSPLALRTLTVPAPQQVIVLDPGHGGHDPGAVSGGANEKIIVLPLAHRLAEYLRQAGLQVAMTREDDSYPSLTQRTEFAQRQHALLFVSLHANAAGESAQGIETFYKSRDEGADDRPWLAPSRALGQAIQSNLGAACPNTRNRGLKPDQRGLAVLRHATYPSVLVELGFLTNDEERSWLMNENYQARQALAIANGIIAFLNQR